MKKTAKDACTFQFIASVTGHLTNDRVRNALNKQHSRGEMAKVMNPQISNTSQITNSPEPLADIPCVRILKRLDVAVFDVRSRWKQIFVLFVRREQFESDHAKIWQWQAVRPLVLAVLLR